jgi:alpha-tubulin suppressor-like RCC1 family protein
VDISAGKGHAGAIIRRRSAVSEYDFENVPYTWGSNKYGQLGLGDFDSRKSPCQAKVNYGTGNGNESSDTLTVSVKDQQPISLVCGDSFTFVRQESGKLYSCGSNV